MLELIKHEFLRYRRWLLMTAVLNVLFIGSGIYLNDYEHAGTSVGVAFTLLMGINAFLLGASQIKTYRSTGMWTFLINRPAKPQQLCLALCTAGGGILLIALVVPYWLLTLAVDWLGIYFIDWRHYAQGIYLLLMTCCCYFSACYIFLTNNKTAYAVLLFPLLILITLFAGGPLIAVAGFSAVWLILLLRAVFKANLDHRPGGWLPVLGIGIPFHLLAFLVLGASTAFCHQVYLMLVDGAGIRVAWNHYFEEQTYDHVSYADHEQRLVLAVDKHADAAYLQRQLANSEVHAIEPQLDYFPWHQQLPYQHSYSQLSLADTTHGMNWVFSHDAMSFLGRKDTTTRGREVNAVSNTDESFIGNLRFVEVPVVLGDQVVTPQQLYLYDPYLQELQLKLQLPEEESLLTAMTAVGQHQVVLSTAALYVFDPVSIANSAAVAEPLVRMPMTQPYENLTGISWAVLMDSHLLALLYGKRSSDDQYPAQQVVYRLYNDYRYERLITRPLSHGFNAYYRQRDMYLSPFWQVVYERLIEPVITAKPPQPHQAWQWPQLGNGLMSVLLGLSLLSGLLTWWLLKQRQVSRPCRVIQSLVAMLTSLAGVWFCWLYYPRKTQFQTGIDYESIE